MRLQDYDTTDRYQATVVASTRLTPATQDEIREIVLDIPRPDLELMAGQSIGVLAPGARVFGSAHHFRLYTVADLPERTEEGHSLVKLAVKRCTYIDDYSGERFDGVASNYLCDLRPGATVTVSGPYGLAFPLPDEPDATLILIGAGTGIAPFRAYLKALRQRLPDFAGRVLLFHGARSGLDLIYRNSEEDVAQYYDRDTFEVIEVLSQRPHWSPELDWDGALLTRGNELWKLMGDPKTLVYVAGLEDIRDRLDRIFGQVAGSAEKWERRKAELAAGHRWVELLY
jgi:ferredoxin--NADP+ reductase